MTNDLRTHNDHVHACISIKLNKEVCTLWINKPSCWMVAPVFLGTLKTKKIAKEGENFTIRLRFYLTIRCRILLRLYHCHIRPNQSLCTHWNSVKVYWTDVLTPLLSRATICFRCGRWIVVCVNCYILNKFYVVSFDFFCALKFNKGWSNIVMQIYWYCETEMHSF